MGRGLATPSSEVAPPGWAMFNLAPVPEAAQALGRLNPHAYRTEVNVLSQILGDGVRQRGAHNAALVLQVPVEFNPRQEALSRAATQGQPPTQGLTPQPLPAWPPVPIPCFPFAPCLLPGGDRDERPFPSAQPTL